MWTYKKNVHDDFIIESEEAPGIWRRVGFIDSEDDALLICVLMNEYHKQIGDRQ